MSTSDASPARTHVTIESRDGCSELYLQNDQYTVVAQGIGSVAANVTPGLYKVRQRVGDTETSHIIDVADAPSQHYSLDATRFASPIPLAGTSTSREFQQAALNQRTPTAPPEGKGAFSLLLRDSGWQHGGSNDRREPALMREASRIRIESFDGTYSRKLLEIAEPHPEAGFVRLWVNLAPRQYVLIQTVDEQTQRCLSIRVLAEWDLHVFFHMPPQQGANDSASLDLDQAAIVYGRPGGELRPSDPNLLLLETARKAFGRRRSSLGPDIIDRVLGGKFGNPVLGLLGAHLLLSSADADPAKANLAVDNTAALLGEDFPDVIALRLRLAAIGFAKPALHPPAVSGPPLVVASYFALTRVPEKLSAPDLSKIFWFPFTVEPTSTWFVWNEAPGARTGLALPDDEAPGGAASFRSGAKDGPGTRRAVQKMIQDLLEHERLQPWVRSLKVSERRSGSAPSGLGALERTLLSTVASAQASIIPGVLDAEDVAEEIVAGLNVPVAAARRSVARLVGGLEKWEKD